MNSRLALATLAVLALVATAGCTTLLGGGGLSDEQLDAEPPEPYRWNDTDANVTIRVHGGRFQAIYHLGNRTSLELYRRGFQQRNALGIRAVRFRYPNGSVVNGSALSVRKGDAVTNVTVPVENGSLAFTAGATEKQFSLPAFVEGSYEVILPKGYRTGLFLFGDVSPDGYERTVEDDRVHIRWEEVSGSVSVRYYLQRDPYIFGGIMGLLGVVAAGGVAYYRLQIRTLVARRREHGLEVEGDDDSDDPPPGFG